MCVYDGSSTRRNYRILNIRFYILQKFRGRGSSVPIVSRVVSGRWTKERGRFQEASAQVRLLQEPGSWKNFRVSFLFLLSKSDTRFIITFDWYYWTVLNMLYFCNIKFQINRYIHTFYEWSTRYERSIKMIYGPRDGQNFITIPSSEIHESEKSLNHYISRICSNMRVVR